MNIYDILLAATPKINDNIKAKLIEQFGSAEAIFNTPIERLASYDKLNRNGAELILSRSAMAQAQSELLYCKNHNITPIAATDSDYPKLLRQISNPPHVIYTIGNRAILNHNLVSFVGTRRISPYGERACHKIIEQLAAKVSNLVIVSGLAHGVDSAAHRAAIDLNIPTIAVLPSPLPIITPSTNSNLARQIVEDGGLLISEQRSTQRNAKLAFIPRNRVVAGLSQATIIIESPLNGGAMKTVKIAASQGRIIGALPGRITDESSAGCNAIIRESVAQIVTSGDDIISLLSWGDRLKEQSEGRGDESADIIDGLSEELLALLRTFRFDEPLHISQLSELSPMSIGALNGALMELCAYGLVRPLAGSMYERVVSIDF